MRLPRDAATSKRPRQTPISHDKTTTKAKNQHLVACREWPRMELDWSKKTNRIGVSTWKVLNFSPFVWFQDGPLLLFCTAFSESVLFFSYTLLLLLWFLWTVLLSLSLRFVIMHSGVMSAEMDSVRMLRLWVNESVSGNFWEKKEESPWRVKGEWLI